MILFHPFHIKFLPSQQFPSSPYYYTILLLLIHPVPDTLPNEKQRSRLLGELLLPEDNPTPQLSQPGGSQGTSLKFFGICSQFLKGKLEV